MEKFKKDKEREIKLEKERMKKKIKGEKKRNDEMCEEVNEIKFKL